MIETNIQEILESAGIKNIELSAFALKEMGISKKRFLQLLKNRQKSPITINELACIKGWIYRFNEVNSNFNQKEKWQEVRKKTYFSPKR